MSQSFPAKAIVAGTAVKFTVNKNAVNVKILNDSTLWLAVYFGSDPPPGNGTTDAGAGWHAQVRPGGEPALGVVGAFNQDFRNILSYQGTGFTGDVWIYPYSPQMLASAGTVSQAQAVAVIAYDANEPVPQGGGGGMPRAVDLSSQPRVIAIPIAAPSYTNSWSPANAGDNQPIFTFGLSANNKANRKCAPYVYGIQMTPDIAASTTGGDIALRCELLDTNDNVLQTTDVWRCFLSWGGNNAQGGQQGPGAGVFPFAAIRANGFSWAQGVDAQKVRFRWWCYSVSTPGTAVPLHWFVMCDLDVNNYVTPGTIGAFTQQVPGANNQGLY